MNWRIAYFRGVQEAIGVLPAGIRARYIHVAQRILTFGPDLGLPHTRALGNGLFEMRVKSKEGIGRVFYCTLSGRRVVMLHAFIKKSQKTPTRDLKLARKRMKEVFDADA
jgi:phage-related protein